MISVRNFCEINNIASNKLFKNPLQYIPENSYYFNTLEAVETAINRNDFETYSLDSGNVKVCKSHDYKYIYIELQDDVEIGKKVILDCPIVMNLNGNKLTNEYAIYFTGDSCVFNGEMYSTHNNGEAMSFIFGKSDTANQSQYNGYTLISNVDFHEDLTTGSSLDSVNSCCVYMCSDYGSFYYCNIVADSSVESTHRYFCVYSMCVNLKFISSTCTVNISKDHSCYALRTSAGQRGSKQTYIENSGIYLLQDFGYDRGYEVDSSGNITYNLMYAIVLTSDTNVCINSTFIQRGGTVHGHKNGHVYKDSSGSTVSLGDKSGYAIYTYNNATLIGCVIEGVAGGLAVGYKGASLQDGSNVYITGGEYWGYGHGGVYNSNETTMIIRDCTLKGASYGSLTPYLTRCQKYNESIPVGANGSCYLGYASTTYMDNVKSTGTYLSTNQRGDSSSPPRYYANAKIYISNFDNDNALGSIRIDGNNRTELDRAAVTFEFGEHNKNIKRVLSATSNLGYIRLVDEDGTKHSLDEYMFGEPYYSDYYDSVDQSHKDWISDRKSKYDTVNNPIDYDKVKIHNMSTPPSVSAGDQGGLYFTESFTDFIESRDGMSYRVDPRDYFAGYSSVPKDYSTMITMIINVQKMLYNKLKEVGYSGEEDTIKNMLNWYKNKVGSDAQEPTLLTKKSLLSDLKNIMMLREYLASILNSIENVSVNSMDIFSTLIEKIPVSNT